MQLLTRITNISMKGENKMKVAITYENGNVFQHFGHTEQFKIYNITEGKVTEEEVVNIDGSGHGALAGFLTGKSVDVLICGGIGRGALNALAEAGIKVYGGVEGKADAAIEEFLAGNLDYNPDIQCSHHGSCHHEEGECKEDKNGCAGNGGCH